MIENEISKLVKELAKGENSRYDRVMRAWDRWYQGSAKWELQRWFDVAHWVVTSQSYLFKQAFGDYIKHTKSGGDDLASFLFFERYWNNLVTLKGSKDDIKLSDLYRVMSSNEYLDLGDLCSPEMLLYSDGDYASTVAVIGDLAKKYTTTEECDLFSGIPSAFEIRESTSRLKAVEEVLEYFKQKPYKLVKNVPREFVEDEIELLKNAGICVKHGKLQLELIQASDSERTLDELNDLITDATDARTLSALISEYCECYQRVMHSVTSELTTAFKHVVFDDECIKFEEIPGYSDVYREVYRVLIDKHYSVCKDGNEVQIRWEVTDDD